MTVCSRVCVLIVFLFIPCFVTAEVVKSMDKRIIDMLRREGRPRSALQISKGVGKLTAKDVNPTLYRLEKEGRVQRTGKYKDGSAPLWGLVQGGSSRGNRG